MAKLYLVRHGRAAAGIDQNPDPGLDHLGRTQAEEAARQFIVHPPMQLFCSPLRRARETAEPLSRTWQRPPTIERRVSEIPFPSADLAERATWLQSVMPGRWRDLEGQWQDWRSSVIDCLLEQREDCVFYSHFIAINVAVGAACADDRVVVFRPDNASITLLSNDGGELNLLHLGSEAATKVN